MSTVLGENFLVCAFRVLLLQYSGDSVKEVSRNKSSSSLSVLWGGGLFFVGVDDGNQI